MNVVMASVVTWLADDAPRNSGPDFGKASPFGLLIVVLLLVATFGLVWSMSRHLRKVPQSFDTEPSDRDEGSGAPEPQDGPARGGQIDPPPREPGG
ncbi:MAG TPA: hypothetical protein VFW21_04485 [Mycobacterium sp.]|nr:hypothetical protein [Mycobacterium sp.]